MEAKKLLKKLGIVLFAHCGCGCGGLMAEMGDLPDRRKLFDTYPNGPHTNETVLMGDVENELVVWNERKGGMKDEVDRD